MHKHKRHRHGPHFFFPGGMIWWFIFAMMFMKGEWWPWILVAVGFWCVFGSMFKAETHKPERKNPPRPIDLAPASAPSKPNFTPTEGFVHRADLLPATCSQCGGPIRSYEVKWTGTHSAACPYCGSNFKMKK